MLSNPKVVVHSHFDWLKKVRIFPESSFPCALNDDRTNVNRGNTYKNVHEYFSMTFQTGVFGMAMTCTGNFGA